MSLSYLKAEQKPLLRVDCSRSTESHSMWYTLGTPQHHGSPTPLTLSSIPLIPSETSHSFRLLFTLFFSNLSNPSNSFFKFSLSPLSWLSRAIETAWLVLDELDLLWLPIIKTWRLNERYYSMLFIASQYQSTVFTHRAIRGERTFVSFHLFNMERTISKCTNTESLSIHS